MWLPVCRSVPGSLTPQLSLTSGLYWAQCLNLPHWIGIVVITGQPGGSGQVYITTQSNLGLSMLVFSRFTYLSLFIFICKCLWPNYPNSLILGITIYTALNVTSHWHVSNMPIHVFYFKPNVCFPRLYVRSIITYVGLNISAQLINIKRGSTES